MNTSVDFSGRSPSLTPEGEFLKLFEKDSYGSHEGKGTIFWRAVNTFKRAWTVNLTDAAYAAGFSSSTHLSATFKSMFDIAPSVLLDRGAEVIPV